MCSYGNWMIETYARFPDLDYGGSGAMPVPAKFKGKKVNWSCGWTFAIDPNTKLVEEGWKLIKWLEGPEYVRAAGTVGLDLTTKDWERQKLPGKPIFAPTPPVYKPAMEVMDKEYYSKLPDNLKKLMASYLESENFAVGCGKIAGLAAAELWTGFKNAWEAGLTKKNTPKEALAAAKKDVQAALDAAWKERRIERPFLPNPAPDVGSPVVSGVGFGRCHGFAAPAIGIVSQERRGPPDFSEEHHARKATQASPEPRGERGVHLLPLSPPLGYRFPVFVLGPIVASLVLSFMRYDVVTAPRFSGPQQLHVSCSARTTALACPWGTPIYYVVFYVPLHLFVALGLALLLNQKVAGCRSTGPCSTSHPLCRSWQARSCGCGSCSPNGA